MGQRRKKKQGWLYDTMVTKRKEYHDAVRRCQVKDNKIKADKSLASAFHKDTSLLNEIKKMNKAGDSSSL